MWVMTQRRTRQKDKLSKERIALLDNIGFVWDPFEQEWHENYRQLKQYTEANDGTKVTTNHPILGIWLSNQRSDKNKEKLSKERIALLDNIGFVWDPFEQEWQNQYAELKKYIEKNGNTIVPRNYPILGIWVSRQRVAKKKGQLSEERIQLLDDIGFIWDASSH